MELRELIGYLCLLLALGGAGAGIWAAGYYAPARVYGRLRARERRERREVRGGT